MIRVVVGHGRSGALRLVADGVAVNAGLPDEPLPQTLVALAKALQRLADGGGAQALELPRSELLWLFEPRGAEVELRWIRRGPPRSAVLKRSRLELSGLCAAVGGALEEVPRTAKLRTRLARVDAPDAGPEPRPGFRASHAAGPLELHLEVEAVPAQHGSLWSSLLAPGRLELREGDRLLAWSDEPPLLAVEDLARWARRALRPGGRAELTLPHGGELACDGDALRLGRHRWPELRKPLAAAVGALALDLVRELGERVPALRRTAPARALRHDAAALVGRGRQQPVAARPDRPRARPPTEEAPAAPLARGSIRKVSFEPLFAARVPFAVSRLEIFGARVFAYGNPGVAALELASGKLAWSRPLRAARAGEVLFAVDTKADRLMRLDLRTGEPRWFRDSEGVRPMAAFPAGPGLAILQEPDALSGRLTETGRALWSFRLPLGETLFAQVTSERIYATTRGGEIAAIAPGTGEILFRAQAPRAFRQAPIRLEHGIFAVLEGDESDELLHADAHSAEVLWGGRLQVRDAGPLAQSGGTVATLGRTGDGWALALVTPGTGEGRLVGTGFTGRAPPTLAATDAGLLVAASDGRIVLYDASGSVRFSDSEPSPATSRALEPVLERRLALVGSEQPALYDLGEGRRVARLPRLEGLTAMATDAELRVAVADDGGNVRGFRLRGHLAVVPDEMAEDTAQ